jgi:hypothetical protein
VCLMCMSCRLLQLSFHYNAVHRGPSGSPVRLPGRLSSITHIYPQPYRPSSQIVLQLLVPDLQNYTSLHAYALNELIVGDAYAKAEAVVYPDAYTKIFIGLSTCAPEQVYAKATYVSLWGCCSSTEAPPPPCPA